MTPEPLVDRIQRLCDEQGWIFLRTDEPGLGPPIAQVRLNAHAHIRGQARTSQGAVAALAKALRQLGIRLPDRGSLDGSEVSAARGSERDPERGGAGARGRPRSQRSALATTRAATRAALDDNHKQGENPDGHTR